MFMKERIRYTVAALLCCGVLVLIAIYIGFSSRNGEGDGALNYTSETKLRVDQKDVGDRPGARRSVPSPDNQPPRVDVSISVETLDEKLDRERIERNYGFVIRGLGLAPEEEEQLLGFLVARLEAARSAHALLSEQKNSKLGDSSKVVKLARADVDKEIAERFGEPLSQKVRFIIENYRYSRYVGSTYLSATELAGVPISPAQGLRLVESHVDTYGPLETKMNFIRVRPLDSVTKLIDLDYDLLRRAAGYLNKTQIELLSAQIAQLNMEVKNQNK
jgi:hypothetical protein